MLNLLIPLFSFGFVFTASTNSPGGHVCRGVGYYLFFSTKPQFCVYENFFVKTACNVWITVLVICASNIIDIYCIYSLVKEINRSTEVTRNMLTVKAYNNRKRYTLVFKRFIDYLTRLVC